MMKLFLVFVLLISCSVVLAQDDERARLTSANQRLAEEMKKGDLKASAKHANEALELSEEIFGGSSRELAIAYENLALILQKDGKHKPAVEAFRKALHIFGLNEAQSRSDIPKTRARLADSLQRSGQSKEAEAIYVNAITEASGNFGVDSIEAANAKTDAACFYFSTRDYAKTIDLFTEGFVIAHRRFGPDSMELDRVASSCGGGVIPVFWQARPGFSNARKRLEAGLGYEPARLVSVKDHALPRDILVRQNVNISEVLVKVWINEEGVPTKVSSVIGDPIYTKMASDVAINSKYRAAMKDGKFISDVVYFSIAFFR